MIARVQLDVPKVQFARLSYRNSISDVFTAVKMSTIPNATHTTLSMTYKIILLLVCGTGFHASMICCWNLYKNESYYCAYIYC